jgi:hypothetical protein
VEGTVKRAVKGAIALAVVGGVLTGMWLALQPSTEPAAAPLVAVERPSPAPRTEARRAVRPRSAPTPVATPDPARASAEALAAMLADTDAPGEPLPEVLADTALPDVPVTGHIASGDIAMAAGQFKRAARHFEAIAEAEGDSALGRIALYRKTQAEWHLGETGAAMGGLEALLELGQDGGVPEGIVEAAERDLDQYRADLP